MLSPTSLLVEMATFICPWLLKMQISTSFCTPAETSPEAKSCWYSRSMLATRTAIRLRAIRVTSFPGLQWIK